MREILFKGFHECENGSTVITVNGEKKRGVWVEGYLYVTHSGEYEISCYNSEIKIERYTYVVIPETVCQYTGLTDKNGKKIFEGDIVGCYGGEFCQGYWEHSALLVADIENYQTLMMFGECKYLEIIGNTLENPELLESEESK